MKAHQNALRYLKHIQFLLLIRQSWHTHTQPIYLCVTDSDKAVPKNNKRGPRNEVRNQASQ